MVDTEEKSPLLAAENAAVQTGDLLEVTKSCTSVYGRPYRGLILFLVSVASFGSYYVYDIPGALQTDISAYYPLTSYQYGLLYSVYAIPNTVICLLGGVLIDTVLGLKVGTMVFAGLIFVGQIMFALSSNLHSVPLAIAGRVVFGLGGESMSVAASTFLSKWFSAPFGSELALAFGIQLSCSRLGSAVNYAVSPRVVTASTLPTALWVGTVITGISFGATLVLAFFDWRGTRQHRRRTGEAVKLDVDDAPRLRDVLQFPLSLWLVFAVCVAFYICVIVCLQFSTAMIVAKHNVSQTVASAIVALPYTVSAISSPFLGLAVDFTGRNVWWLIVSSGTMVVVQVLLLVAPVGYQNQGVAYALFIVCGCSYSVMAAALWPCVALLVRQELLGSAFGLMTAIQNTGLALAPLLIAKLLEDAGGLYYNVQVLYIVLAVVSLLASCALWYVDARLEGGHVLNAPGALMRERKQQTGEDTAASKKVQQHTQQPLAAAPDM